MSEAMTKDLTEEQRSSLCEKNLDDEGIRFDAPRVYAGILDIAAMHDINDIEGKSVLDYGCCELRHLQSLARMGVDVVGVAAGISLTVLCNNLEDFGELTGPDGKTGHLKLMYNSDQEPDKIAEQNKQRFDLITIRNILHQNDPDDYTSSDTWIELSLGRDKEVIVSTLYDLLKPGGHLISYNITTSSDITENAIARKFWDNAGFEIISFDQDDSGSAIGISMELGWDTTDNPNHQDIQAMYTMVRRPPE